MNLIVLQCIMILHISIIPIWPNRHSADRKLMHEADRIANTTSNRVQKINAKLRMVYDG